MLLIPSCSYLCTIHWIQVLSREWRYSCSSADRPCFNYIKVINNFIAYKGVTYIRCLTVYNVRETTNGECRPGGDYWDYSSSRLSLKQVTLVYLRSSAHKFQVFEFQFLYASVSVYYWLHHCWYYADGSCFVVLCWALFGRYYLYS